MVTLALHKPYGMLSRFTSDGSKWRTLGELGLPRDVWPIGRLDADSEGLLILSSDKRLVDRLLSPAREHRKRYWVQIERLPSDEALQRLRDGVSVEGALTRPARVRRLDEQETSGVPPRDPPIRYRKSVPDCWIELEIVEGRNRQVRRMTAAVGHPTLRLMRVAIGDYRLGALAPGQFVELTEEDRARLLGA